VNRWLRLRRSGSTIIGYTSTSWGEWTEVGRMSVGLGTDVLLGLATSARSTAATVTARYRELTDLRSVTNLPAAPSGLAGSFQDGLGVELSWSGGPGSYHLQRREAGGLWQALGFVEGVAQFTDTSAQGERFYEYRVAEETAAGVGAFSAPAGVIT
jgi:hypothetical protein